MTYLWPVKDWSYNLEKAFALYDRDEVVDKLGCYTVRIDRWRALKHFLVAQPLLVPIVGTITLLALERFASYPKEDPVALSTFINGEGFVKWSEAEGLREDRDGTMESEHPGH